MKAFRKLLPLFLICFLLAACGSEFTPTAPETTEAATESVPELKDWAGELELDLSTDAQKQHVTVKSFIDGDTTHFHMREDVMPGGVFKARFLAINTPESTGKIEEYGKAAARFTREKLENAVSILIESEDGPWIADSTGDRYLVWVWYQPEEGAPYRNLNVELLQEGLALPNGAGANRYGETCLAASQQAREAKKGIFSGLPDPDYYYGDAVELTLKELRCNIESYNGVKVAFNGIITANSGTQGVYVEEYDPETGLYFGIYVYYGHGLNGMGLDAITVGNLTRIVGTVQYYEAGGTWQVSDLSYDMMDPKNPNNLLKLSDGHSPAYVLTDADTFANGKVCYEQSDEDEVRFVTAPYAAMVLGTSVEMQNLTVVDAYTTDNAESSSNGAITLYCEKEGVSITIRTLPMRDENGALITQEHYLGKTIDVKGIVDYFDGAYQIKVFTPENITIK